jgi:UDP-N-acetylmuramoyl-L-alanyl-D-glutamate--2,6-diaminopimelate ligase
MSTDLTRLCGHDIDLDNGPDEIEIAGLSADSREIRKDFLFAALPGTVVDGVKFIANAIDNGATVILVGRHTKIEVDVPDAVVVLRAKEPRKALAKIAARFYGRQPDCVAAVTGTNGKSSVVAFVRQMWQAMGMLSASLGTVGIEHPGGFEKLAHTTPDPVVLQKAVAKLARNGVDHLAIEASSHGLEQHRLDGLKICVGAFTNFSQDHLDYHKTFEAYFAAKMRLFDALLCEGCAAVVNMDCAQAGEVIKHVKKRRSRVFSVGRKGKDLQLLEASRLGLGQRLKIKGREGIHQVYLPLVGDFQISNAMVAAGVVIAAGGSESVAIKTFENLHGAKGRLELVERDKHGAAVFVDFAHTPDALDVALGALRPFAEKRLIVVFGAGGDRDKLKRPLMGEVAARLADKVFVTDDNPRTEDAGAVRKEILAGCPKAIEIGDRGKAIEAAIADLQDGDVLLIAGKGHEEGQIVGDKVIPFSDHEAVQSTIRGQAA